MSLGLIEDKVEDFSVATGAVEPPKPPLIFFKNYKDALQMLHKHMADKSSKILIHADVDLDGIGAAFVVRQALTFMWCANRVSTIINKEKIHGMSQNAVSAVNGANIGLFIIVDSSSNDIEYIKQMNCDVLVIDHHSVGHTQYTGETAGGHYIIINNMIDNPESGYKADPDMSGALVAYELFKIMEAWFQLEHSVLEDRMLYQWVGCTLVSDAINNRSNRNQWYMQKTVHNFDIEPSLKIMMNNLDKYSSLLTKTFIGFKLAPTFNKAIRAGASPEALHIALSDPYNINNLLKYGDMQNDIVNRSLSNVTEQNGVCFRSLDADNIGSSYSGIVAMTVLNNYDKSCIAYKDMGGYIKGSFRGKMQSFDYRGLLDRNGIMAQGHESAFGVEIAYEDIPRVSQIICEAEKVYNYRPYIALFGAEKVLNPIHQLEDFDAFKRSGGMYNIGMVNSTLATAESINLVVPKSEIELEEVYEKYSLGKVHGIGFKTFEKEFSPYVNIYIEFGNNLEVYVKNNKQIKVA